MPHMTYIFVSICELRRHLPIEMFNKIETINVLLYYNNHRMSDYEHDFYGGGDSGTDSDGDEEQPSTGMLKTNHLKTKKLTVDVDEDILRDDADADEDDSDENTNDSDYDEGETNIDENEDTDNEKGEDDDMHGGERDEDSDNGENEINTVKKSALGYTINITDIIEDDDDEELDDNYLQKFDEIIQKNYIDTYHPECLSHNSDEVMKLAKVSRDAENNVIDPLHKTLPILTKYERARILGQRAKQIQCGSKPFVKVPDNIIDENVIAELELREKKIPFIIRRPIPSGAFEYWHVRDLENIYF